MIPLRDQENLRIRFRSDLQNRVRIDYFTQKKSPVIIPGRPDCPLCEEGRILMSEVASLSDRITLSVHEISESEEVATQLGVDKVPATVLRGQQSRPVRFFGLPSGPQFPVLIETMLDAARGTVALSEESMKQLKRLKQDVAIQVFTQPACSFSAALARLAYKLALQSPRIRVDVVELSEFPQLAQHYSVKVTPTTIIDGNVVLPGSLDEATLVGFVMRVALKQPLNQDTTRTGQGTVFRLPGEAPPQQEPRRTQSGIYIPG